MKTIKFYTLGCKVNQYETQNIREKFIAGGFKEIGSRSPADICVINTCTVTHKADSESVNFIRRANRENPSARIVVTGCLAGLDSAALKKLSGVSLIVKNKDKNRLFGLLTGKGAGMRISGEGISYFKNHTRAFLKIQDGCSNYCSYCKVPLVRGAPKSKPLDAIIREAKQLVRNNFKEIVLSGICLGLYGRDLSPRATLAQVIAALESVKGLLRIRLSSIEAGDVTDELIAKIAESKKLCRHLHIPVQSGDDTVLKKMNRRYTSGIYLALIKKLKKAIPGIAITTDVLVGFPAESEANFQNTLKLIRKIKPLKVHIFAYSERKGTAASVNFPEKLGPGIIKDRQLRLGALSILMAEKYALRFLNKSMPVLLEGRSRKNPLFWEGFTDNYLKVRIESCQDLKNRIIRVKLRKKNIGLGWED